MPSENRSGTRGDVGTPPDKKSGKYCRTDLEGKTFLTKGPWARCEILTLAVAGGSVFVKRRKSNS